MNITRRTETQRGKETAARQCKPLPRCRRQCGGDTAHCGGQKRGTHRLATRHVSARNANAGGKTYHLVRKRGARAPLFRTFRFSAAGGAWSARRRKPCPVFCRGLPRRISPPVRSAADLLVNVVLVAVGIRLHAHVITLRRAAAAHADADDLFAAHRFALEIENTAFAAFAGSHF